MRASVICMYSIRYGRTFFFFSASEFALFYVRRLSEKPNLRVFSQGMIVMVPVVVSIYEYSSVSDP